MTNEEKILTILEQMQGDVADLKQGQVRLEERVADLEQSDQVSRRSLLNMENVLLPNIKLAIDGIVGLDHYNEEQDNRIRKLEDRVERHDVEIFELRQSVG